METVRAAKVTVAITTARDMCARITMGKDKNAAIRKATRAVACIMENET